MLYCGMDLHVLNAQIFARVGIVKAAFFEIFCDQITVVIMILAPISRSVMGVALWQPSYGQSENKYMKVLQI